MSQYAVAIVEDSDGQLLLRQRPQTGREREREQALNNIILCGHQLLIILCDIVLSGLLAGLWEFPAVPVEGEEPEGKMWDKLYKELIIGGAGDIEHHHHIGLVS